MEKENGQPANWHAMLTDINKNQYEVFKDDLEKGSLNFGNRAPLLWSNRVYMDKSGNYFSLGKFNKTFHTYDELK